MLPVPRYRYFGGGEIPSYNGAGTPGVDYTHTLGDGPRVGPSINPAFRDPNYVSNAPHSAVTYTTATPSPSASPFRDVRPTRGWEDGYGLDPSNTRGNPFYDWNTAPAVAATPAVPGNILTQFTQLPGNAPHSALDFSGDYTPGNAPHSALDFSGDYTPGNAPHSAVDFTPDSSSASLPWWKEQTGLAPFVTSSPSPDEPAAPAAVSPTPSPAPDPTPSPSPSPDSSPTPDPAPSPAPDPTPSPSPTPEPSPSPTPEPSPSPAPTESPGASPEPTLFAPRHDPAPPYQGSLTNFGGPFNIGPIPVPQYVPPVNAGNIIYGAQTPTLNTSRGTLEWFTPDGQMHSVPAPTGSSPDNYPRPGTYPNPGNAPESTHSNATSAEDTRPGFWRNVFGKFLPKEESVHDNAESNPPDETSTTRQTPAPAPVPAPPAGGRRWDFTQGRYVNTNNATGAQFSSRAANALEMWAQGLFGNVNQGQDERSLRSGGGQVSHLDEFGNLTQTGTLAANARSNTQLYRPFVYGSQGGGRPLGGGYPTTGVGTGG